MEWRIRIPSVLFRLGMKKANGDANVLVTIMVDALERYVTGDRESQQTGEQGGKVRAKRLTPEQRTAIATMGGQARQATPEALSRRASKIAGAAWDDREQVGTLADQLRAVAQTPAVGGDGDLTPNDRDALLRLAALAELHRS